LESLLTLFVAIVALAVVAQACVLIAIYIHSKRLAVQVERFMNETKDVMVPIKSITENLRVASGNLVEIGISAREQFRRIETMVAETGEALHSQLERLDKTSTDVADRINETADIVQDSIIKPVREISAFAKGLTRGFETFLFRRNKSTVDKAHQDEELFI